MPFQFFKSQWFYALHDDNSSVTQYIRVNGNIVKRTTVKDIKEFVRGWVVDRFEERDILNLVLNTPKLTNAALESLREVSIDFTSYTNRSQLFFFPNKTVEVRKAYEEGESLKVYEPGSDELHNYVWEDNVIPHKYKRMPDAFTIKKCMTRMANCILI